MNQQVVTIGGTRQKAPPRSIISVEGTDYDVSPLNKTFFDLGSAIKYAAKNPYAVKPLLMAQQASQNLARISLPPALQKILGPMMSQARVIAMASAQAIKLRVEQSARLAKQPTQLLPINLSLANGATTTPIIIQSPYLGSGGAGGEGLWSITAIKTGALSGLRGMRFTSAIFAGHDYVAAATTATTINYTGVATGKSSVLGWPLEAFADDAFKQTEAVFRPWNVLGVNPVMRETGNFTVAINNATGSTFNGDIQVFVQANLCGTPFKPEDVQRMYVPAAQQAIKTLAIARGLGKKWAGMFGSGSQALRGLDDMAGAMEDLEGLSDDQVWVPG